MELPDLHTFLVPSDEIAPTANEWLSGFIAYFNHTETNDTSIYQELVANITDVEGLWEDNSDLNTSFSLAVKENCSILFISSTFLLLKVSETFHNLYNNH